MANIILRADKKKVYILIVASTIIITGDIIPFLFLLNGEEDFNNKDDGEINTDDDNNEMFILESGTYTGRCFFGKNILILEGNEVIFQNAQILGSEIYVFGYLKIENSIIDYSIYGYGNGNIDINNLEIYSAGTIKLYENCKANIKNISGKYFNSAPSISVLDTSNLIISYSKVFISVYINSIINATNLYNNSWLTFYDNSHGTIRSSNTTVSCYESAVIYILQNTIIRYLYCPGTTAGNPFNNAIIYKDGTSTILQSSLTDNAQIINI
ncbi:MAG: hypothetical protein ACTSPW_15290 [Promethearchaeota archaeon]